MADSTGSSPLIINLGSPATSGNPTGSPIATITVRASTHAAAPNYAAGLPPKPLRQAPAKPAPERRHPPVATLKTTSWEPSKVLGVINERFKQGGNQGQAEQSVAIPTQGGGVNMHFGRTETGYWVGANSPAGQGGPHVQDPVFGLNEEQMKSLLTTAHDRPDQILKEIQKLREPSAPAAVAAKAPPVRVARMPSGPGVRG